MIGSLTGTVLSNSQNPILISVNDVGYLVYVLPGCISKLKVGSKHMIYTHMHVRDDAIELFGFDTQEELQLFSHLLVVSGIGPKTALLVTDRGVESVTRAITTGDVDFFISVPRLGRKNAQKIIIELKNKLGMVKELDLTSEATGQTREFIDVLSSMGFARNEIVGALKKLDEKSKTLEEKLRQALKYLGKPST